MSLSSAQSMPAAGRTLAERRWGYVMGAGYVLAALLTGIAVLMASAPPATGPLGPASRIILTLLGVNLVLILALAAAVGWRLLKLLAARSSDAGVRLHLRFVTLFALAAVAPAVIVALFYGVLISRGVENWFSTRVQTVVGNSATVARSYVDEQQAYIANHLNPMAGDLNRAAPGLQATPVTFSRFLGELAAYHDFPAAYLIDREGRVLARAESPGAPGFLSPSRAGFDAADEGDISAESFAASDLLRALYKLDGYEDAYLYVARKVDPGILNHLRETEASLIAYREAAESREQIQAAFALSYAETVLLVLVGAVWLGLAAASQISAPVGRLVQAAGRVAGGDLDARVNADRDPAEIAVLSRAFNSMTSELQAQQAALKHAGDEAEQRSQFIEAVLAGVSAGVVGLDASGRVSAMNRQASALLDILASDGFGRPLGEVAPEFAAVASRAELTNEAEEEVDLARGGETRRVRVRAGRSETGLVLTFDDITRLVAAQRNAAWRDVARRIAHEIKNPLTPIQLSAERLRRKFRKGVDESELEVFDRCTDTIVRQVGDIGRMVDEFSAFARMPAPRFAEQDAAELLRAAAFSQKVASPDIDVELEEPEATRIVADERMIAQALTNVFKNAAEAIAGRLVAEPAVRGRIRARLVTVRDKVAFEVEDNGVGLPAKDRDRLTEPYVTTREKGTGLGLAIVKRIMEDHGGDLILTDASELPGARTVLRLPLKAAAPQTTPFEVEA